MSIESRRILAADGSPLRVGQPPREPEAPAEGQPGSRTNPVVRAYGERGALGTRSNPVVREFGEREALTRDRMGLAPAKANEWAPRSLSELSGRNPGRAAVVPDRPSLVAKPARPPRAALEAEADAAGADFER